MTTKPEMTTHDDMPHQNLSERIKLLRLRAGMKQPADLAKASRVSAGTISRLESGEQKTLTTKTATKLAKALGCSIAELDENGPLVLPVGTQPRATPQPTPAGDGWQLVDMDALVLAYLDSEWFLADAPTPEEMRWIRDLPQLEYRDVPPDESLISRMLGRRRNRKS